MGVNIFREGVCKWHLFYGRKMTPTVVELWPGVIFLRRIMTPGHYSTGVIIRRYNGHTDGQTDAGQSDPYVPLCFAGDTKITARQLNIYF